MSLLKKLGPLAGLAGLAAIIGTGGAAAPAVLAAEGAGALGAGAAAAGTGLTLGGATAATGLGGGTGLLGTLGGTTTAATGMGGGAGLIGSLPTLGAVEAAPVALAAGNTPISGGYFDGATPDGLLAANTPQQSGGLLDGFKGAMDKVKPYTDAASNASKVMGQFQSAPVNAPQPGSKTDGGAASAQLFNSIQQTDLQRMQEELAKRQKMNSMFGGGNGWTA